MSQAARREEAAPAVDTPGNRAARSNFYITPFSCTSPVSAPAHVCRRRTSRRSSAGCLPFAPYITSGAKVRAVPRLSARRRALSTEACRRAVARPSWRACPSRHPLSRRARPIPSKAPSSPPALRGSRQGNLCARCARCAKPPCCAPPQGSSALAWRAVSRPGRHAAARAGAVRQLQAAIQGLPPQGRPLDGADPHARPP